MAIPFRGASIVRYHNRYHSSNFIENFDCFCNFLLPLSRDYQMLLGTLDCGCVIVEFTVDNVAMCSVASG
jgi:hypothetical protein